VVVVAPAPKEAAKTLPIAVAASARAPELAAMLWPRPKPSEPGKIPRPPRRRAIDVGAVITRALTAAGLMK
jgi:hypothetical protein